MTRTTLSLTLALALSAAAAFAQSPAQQTPHSPNPHRQAKRLAKELNLTPDQTARVEPLLADRDQKIAAVRADSSIAPVVAQQQVRAIQKSTRDQLSTILTPEQLQQMRQRQHNQHGGNQTQPGAQPPV